MMTLEEIKLDLEAATDLERELWAKFKAIDAQRDPVLSEWSKVSTRLKELRFRAEMLEKMAAEGAKV